MIGEPPHRLTPALIPLSAIRVGEPFVEYERGSNSILHKSEGVEFRLRAQNQQAAVSFKLRIIASRKL